MIKSEDFSFKSLILKDSESLVICKVSVFILDYIITDIFTLTWMNYVFTSRINLSVFKLWFSFHTWQCLNLITQNLFL